MTTAADLAATVREYVEQTEANYTRGDCIRALDALLARCEQAERGRSIASASLAIENARAEAAEAERDEARSLAESATECWRQLVDRVAVAEARVAELEAAIDTAIHNIGVPSGEYPAPIAHAYDVLVAALGGTP